MSRFNDDNIAESMGLGVGDGPVEGAPPIQDAPKSRPFDGVKRLDEKAGLIPIDRIVPDPDQPRVHFNEEELDRLADTIRERGLLQPIRVRWDDQIARFVIIAGERRWRACRKAGETTIPALWEQKNLDPRDILVDQLVENCTRQDLDVVEQAKAYKHMMDVLGFNQDQVAKKIGVPPSHISKCLRILTLDEDVQAQVVRGELPASKAYKMAIDANPRKSLSKSRTSVFNLMIHEGKYKADVRITIHCPGLPESEAMPILELAKRQLKAIIDQERSREAG